MNFTVELEGNAPLWASEAISYFENEYREQWIAKINKNKNEIIIAGSDIGWKEIIVNLEKAEEYLRIERESVFANSKKENEFFSKKRKEAKINNNSLYKYIFTEVEKNWLFSILTSFAKYNGMQQKSVL